MRDTRYLTYDECVLRYPRLVRAMCELAILSPGEAGAALRDYRTSRETGYTYLERWGGGEAVSHYGGPLAVIRDAICCRHACRTLGLR